jgi:hypothetical protein
MTKIYILIISSLLYLNSTAADTLFVKMEKRELKKHDTIYFECNFKYEKPEESKITLNVIIENFQKTRQWKFRYPLLQGYISPAIIIDSTIQDGKYAVNFLIQKDFLVISGKIKDHNPKSKGLNYLMLGKDKASFFDIIKPDQQGNFSTHKMIFEDTARFVFSEIGKKNEYLYIDLKTTIDSAYTPIAQKTEFINIGGTNANSDTSFSNNYKFEFGNTYDNFTLKEVIVKTLKKKKVELFDEDYSSGLFKFGFPTIFDGLESDQIGNSIDIFTFLQGRVAGLNINKDITGNYALKWRGGNVDVYLDEFKVEDDIASYVNTNDIAMIKVYPPMGGGPTGNGTIAIYTKRGTYTDNMNRKYNFLVKGYRPLISNWK